MDGELRRIDPSKLLTDRQFFLMHLDHASSFRAAAKIIKSMHRDLRPAIKVVVVNSDVKVVTVPGDPKVKERLAARRREIAEAVDEILRQVEPGDVEAAQADTRVIMNRGDRDGPWSPGKDGKAAGVVPI